MSNLTFDEKLVREHKAEPLEGHAVVVLERVGKSGEKFHSLLEPGDDRPRRGLMDLLRGKPDVYSAFAVDASKHRLLSFSSHVEMAEHAHDFELHFSLWYRASDAQLLVSTRLGDPLELVRKKVVEVVTEEIAELPWNEVWESFRVASDRVVAGTIATIKSFSRDYGIAINSLRLRAKFPESAVAVDKRIHRVREQARLGRERADAASEVLNHRKVLRRENAELDEEDRALAARARLQDRISHETTEKYASLIREAGSAVELREVHGALGVPSTAGFGGYAHVHNGSNGHAIGPGVRASLALSPGGTGLSSVLTELLALTHIRPDAQCRRIRGTLLHVVASVVADDSLQVSTELAEYARRARLEIDAATHLPMEQIEALLALADPHWLRQRL